MLFKRLPVAEAVFRANRLPAAVVDYARDEVRLSWTARADTRGRHRTESGVEFGVMLPPFTVLVDGDCLALDSAKTLVVVRSVQEDVLVATPSSAHECARWAYLVGNSHQPLMVGDGELVCPATREAEQVLLFHQVPFTRERRVFTPEATGPGHH